MRLRASIFAAAIVGMLSAASAIADRGIGLAWQDCSCRASAHCEDDSRFRPFTSRVSAYAA